MEATKFFDDRIMTDDRLIYAPDGSEYQLHTWIQEAYEKFAILHANHIQCIENQKQLNGEGFNIETLHYVIRHEFKTIFSERLLLSKLIDSRAKNMGLLK